MDADHPSLKIMFKSVHPFSRAVFQLAGSFRGVFTLRHSPRELFTRLADGAELGHGFVGS